MFLRRLLHFLRPARLSERMAAFRPLRDVSKEQPTLVRALYDSLSTEGTVVRAYLFLADINNNPGMLVIGLCFLGDVAHEEVIGLCRRRFKEVFPGDVAAILPLSRHDEAVCLRIANPFYSRNEGRR